MNNIALRSQAKGKFMLWFRQHPKRVFIVLAIIIVVLGLVVILSAQRGQGPTEAQVISAFHASFPNFCSDGQILAEDAENDQAFRALYQPAGRYWGIRCDAWLKNPTGFYGYATIVDTAQCTTVRPVINTVGEYYFDVETLNQSNGKKMTVCPAPNVNPY